MFFKPSNPRKNRLLQACDAMALSVAFMGAALPARAQEILTSRAPNREELLLEGARKEGQVVLYSAAIVNQALRPMAEAFMKKYPFIKLTFWRGDTEEIIAKLSAEVRAKNVVVDLIEGTGVGELAVESGLTVPFYTPAVEALPEMYRDPRGNWASTRVSYFGIAYNPKLVPPDQAPKTYDDLLDPRWKGKLA
jgi:ABC-type thiamine transport system substrate-binding protein